MDQSFPFVVLWQAEHDDYQKKKKKENEMQNNNLILEILCFEQVDMKSVTKNEMWLNTQV